MCGIDASGACAIYRGLAGNMPDSMVDDEFGLEDERDAEVLGEGAILTATSGTQKIVSCVKLFFV